MKPSEYLSESRALSKYSHNPFERVSKGLVKNNILKFGDQSNSYFHLQNDVSYFYDSSRYDHLLIRSSLE